MENNGNRMPVPGLHCPHCGSPLFKEEDPEIDYPLVCLECDENFHYYEAEERD